MGVDSARGGIVDRFVGVGNPFRTQSPGVGEEVLDLGCGCGFDVFFAALLVGLTGRAVGVDLTPEMLTWPRRHAKSMRNVQFEEADLTSLPFADSSFNLASSNGVLNLVPDKKTALQEVHRVLRPGGRFVAADLLVIETIPEDVLSDADAWST